MVRMRSKCTTMTASSSASPFRRVAFGSRTSTLSRPRYHGHRHHHEQHQQHPLQTLEVRCGAKGGSSKEYRQQGAEVFDAVGLGQAMVDYAGYVSDDFLNDVLAELNAASSSDRHDNHRHKKGDRIVVTPEDLGKVLNKLNSENFKVTTGGSLSNTLVALSRLGNSRNGGDDDGAGELKVGMAGLVGSDPIGSFYRAKMDKAGVSFLSQPTHQTTGTVVVLTTPDAQRTMLSHFPEPPEPSSSSSSSSSVLTPSVVNSIVSSRVMLVEGYLLECGERVIGSMMEAMRLASENGTLVCMTLSDTSVVSRHSDKLWRALRKEGLVDIVFANAQEAMALTGEAEPRGAALNLAQHTKVVSVVTDGHHGSHLAGMGASQLVPAYWMPKGPLDTCGAGDAYAAGAIYGLLSGASIRGMGYSGARVSSTVISQTGARLKREDADKLVEVLPMMMFESTRLVIPGEASENEKRVRVNSSPKGGK